MNSPRSIQVSPRHQVLIDPDFAPMIDRAPREDFVVRTLAKRTAGSMPLMSGDLVIAGAATRQAHPLADRYPLHFRKTYYPGRLHGDPRAEFERHTLASSLIALPEPIGYTRSTFRSCLLPGTPFDRLSELGSEPDERNIAVARELSLGAAAGLFRLAEEAFSCLCAMQRGGLTHGDAHLHNFLVCPSPLEVLPVDFEIAATESSMPAEQWRARCRADRAHLLKLAVFLQSALGQQHGELAGESLERIDELVRPAEPFRRAIYERSYGGGGFT